MLFRLLEKSWGSELRVISDETPPKEGERDGGGMPESMGINKFQVWRKVVYIQQHR